MVTEMHPYVMAPPAPTPFSSDPSEIVWFPRNNDLVYVTDVGREDDIPFRRVFHFRLNHNYASAVSRFGVQVSDRAPVIVRRQGLTPKTRRHYKPTVRFFTQLEVLGQNSDFGFRVYVTIDARLVSWMRPIWYGGEGQNLSRIALLPPFTLGSVPFHDVTVPPWPPLV